MADVRAIIFAKGDVQRVGYRDVVERIARKMKLTGFVENIKPYDVKIVCEGDKARIEEFKEKINIKEFPIYVEELDVVFEPATGEFEYFEIKRGEWSEELGERIDAARVELTRLHSDITDFRHDSNENFKMLHSDLTKHDVAAQNRIETLSKEIIELRERIIRVENLVEKVV